MVASRCFAQLCFIAGLAAAGSLCASSSGGSESCDDSWREQVREWAAAHRGVAGLEVQWLVTRPVVSGATGESVAQEIQRTSSLLRWPDCFRMHTAAVALETDSGPVELFESEEPADIARARDSSRVLLSAPDGRWYEVRPVLRTFRSLGHRALREDLGQHATDAPTLLALWLDEQPLDDLTIEPTDGDRAMLRLDAVNLRAVFGRVDGAVVIHRLERLGSDGGVLHAFEYGQFQRVRGLPAPVASRRTLFAAQSRFVIRDGRPVAAGRADELSRVGSDRLARFVVREIADEEFEPDLEGMVSVDPRTGELRNESGVAVGESA